MTHRKTMLFILTLGWSQSLLGATVTKFSKKMNLIEISGEADELLGMTAGESVDLTFGDTTAQGVVKKVLPGNRLHVELQGEVDGIKKGLEIKIAEKQINVGEVGDAEPVEKPSATIVRVGKNKIAVKPNPQWDSELRKLKKGEKIKVFFSNRTEPLTLIFEKVGKSGFEFLFKKADKLSIVKDVEVTPFQEETAPAASVSTPNLTPLPWFAGSSAARIFTLKGKFFDVGYRYSGLDAVYEVDGNSEEESDKYNGVALGADAEFGVFRVSLAIDRLTQKDSAELEMLQSELWLAAATKYIDVALAVAQFKADSRSGDFVSNSAGVLAGVAVGWHNEYLGISGLYQPRSDIKQDASYTDPSSGEKTQFNSTFKTSTYAELDFWAQPSSRLRLNLSIGNDYNDGGSERDGEFENDEKVLANERLAFVIGGTWIGTSGFQLSTGVSRNQQGLLFHRKSYQSVAPSTGIYIGAAQLFGKFAFGTGLEMQRGGIVKENEEAGFDVTTTAELRLFSLSAAIVL